MTGRAGCTEASRDDGLIAEGGLALEYQLKFEDGVVLKTLAAALLAAGFDATDDPFTFRGDGLMAVVKGAQDRFGRWKPLRFRPKVELFFALDKQADYEGAMATLVETVGRLLETIDADAALAFDNEAVLLLRRRGDLALTNRENWWGTCAKGRPLNDWLGLQARVEPLPVL